MQFRPYGSTGRMISILGISTTAFFEEKEIDKYSSSIVHAFDKGVNYFDSSPFAHDGIGEKALSKAIVEMRKTGHPYNLASRTMATNATELMKDHNQGDSNNHGKRYEKNKGENQQCSSNSF